MVARILVVEDDHDLNNAYSLILRHEGHEVVEAFDGKEAIDKLDSFSPDLILLDLLMPIMGGLEFLQWWNKSNPGSEVKVLIFTNMENSPEVSEAYKLGANRCIIKSWTAPHNLAKVVSDTLKAKREAKSDTVKTKA
ncbi:MAG TPA: response regulator [Candidatus Saccharimonadales bacterium]|jgi:DNA-binding response OmpR family regulator|nr:response regulator [Candidatus Saccharimonadales bacterium]